MRNVSRPYGPIYGPGIAVMLLFAMPAFGQTLNSTSGSVSGATSGSSLNSNISGNPIGNGASSSTSNSGSTSGSRSSANSGTSNVRSYNGQTTNSRQAVTVNVDPGSGGGASDPASDPAGSLPVGSPGNPYSANINNSGTQTLRNTPEIVAPNISGGNPCLVGISGGGAGPGIGITLGIGYSDKGCERRNSAALLSNIGERQAAVELMCQDMNVRWALARAGHPCEEDRQRWAAMAQHAAAADPPPVVQTAGRVDPAVVRRQQEVALAPVRLGPQPPARPDNRPGWCFDGNMPKGVSYSQFNSVCGH